MADMTAQQKMSRGYAEGPEGQRRAREQAIAAVRAAVAVLPADELIEFKAQIDELIRTPDADDAA